MYVGENAGSEGIVNVSGSNVSTGGPSVLNANSAAIGFYGDGVLNIADGALVTNSSGFLVGDWASAIGVVNVAGFAANGQSSTLDINWLISVGVNEGTGIVNVSDGGFLHTVGALVGEYNGASGTVNIMNATWVNDSTIEIGRNGAGVLNILDGAVINTTGPVVAGTLNQGTGKISVSGTNESGSPSTITSASDAYIGYMGAGVLNLADEAVFSVPSAFLAVETGSSGVLTIGASFNEAARAPGTLSTPSLEFGPGAGQLVFNHTDNTGAYEFGAVITGGNGSVSSAVDVVAGETVMTGVGSDYFGTTTVSGGTLAAGAANVFSANSDYAVDTAGTIDLRGNSQTVASLANGGLINMGTDTAAGAVLNVTGDYVGNAGTIAFNTVLGDDNSATDLLNVSGSTSGTTSVAVTNAGGNGAPTTEGIKIINVAGASEGEFTLLGDYVTEDNQQAVVGGAYAYTLEHNGISTPTDGNWYLRSRMTYTDDVGNGDNGGDNGGGTGGDNGGNGNGGNGGGDRELPGEPEDPRYQPGVPVYEAYAQSLLGLNGLSTLQQRVGNRVWAGSGNRVIAQGADAIQPYAAPEEAGVAIEGNGVWGRIEGAHHRMEPGRSTTGVDYNQNVFKMQAGVDGLLTETEAGRLIGAVSVHYVHGSTKASSIYDTINGGGKISTDGYGLGGTLTWYGQNGFYFDAQGQATWYDSDLSFDGGNRSLADGNTGFGYALSLEGGKRFAIDPQWSITPQAQLVYSRVKFDDFNDTFGAGVSFDKGASLQGRLGVTLDHQTSWQNDKGLMNRTKVYGIANLYYEFLEGTRVDVSDVSFANRQDRTWGGLGIGGSYNWDNDKFSVYGEGLVDTSLNNFGDSYSVKGNIGFRVKF
ncbi:hypothetical protein BRY73_24710 [Ochrobactrum sp. P6BS-III]|nr:hypothetical protein BRY73_24710 [Ochrobactrum sp. P6BS-III]